MRNENDNLIIGLCGSTIGARKEALQLLFDALSDVKDVTIPGSVRATWRRGDALGEVLQEFNDTDGNGAAIAMITCREEAESIELFDGVIIHVEGNPSDDISIDRHHLLLTFKEQSRGRYTTLADTLVKLGEQPE
ncbi:MAG: hypothetical protein ACRCXB_23555 [Aeromonadaceae bacterium]